MEFSLSNSFIILLFSFDLSRSSCYYSLIFSWNSGSADFWTAFKHFYRSTLSFSVLKMIISWRRNISSYVSFFSFITSSSRGSSFLQSVPSLAETDALYFAFCLLCCCIFLYFLSFCYIFSDVNSGSTYLFSVFVTLLDLFSFSPLGFLSDSFPL